ncbi:GHMP kinase [Flavobacterium cyanobacteriorum]|uniref:GHMP kinase n=1 Tax=Flavobacterium cyanobacteriorum TaxID=2022802 RepID=A0A255Z0E1_9FLAO|nr:GYDIA family GHMP kinase [Flavobacterium cyanobacteriorum]OYQ34385.1 GHMP kinase [Flavobacterium cyanobacteriorum]
MKQTFYSNGKLLLTGEYVVLDGVTALAVPTVFGQYLETELITGKTIYWKSIDSDGSIWYEDVIPFSTVEANEHREGKPERNTLVTILHEAMLANPEVLNDAAGYKVTTRLTFPRRWGLGTSSTLVNNIAQWFGIDAFELLNRSFGGSGYDIACAQHNHPIYYSLHNKKPLVKEAPFNPPFAENIYFVYLNKKQDSRNAIAAYRNRQGNIKSIEEQINELTQKVAETKDFRHFCIAIEQHEAIMATLLGLTPVKEQWFPDFNGAVKSLGAWGGDFVMALTDTDPTAYFRSKGYPIIIPYHKMILNK